MKINNLWQAFHRVLERLRTAKTMYRRIKLFLILAFVALAIFQTGQLWFVNISNRNFFLFLSNQRRGSVADGHHEFVRPMRWIYGDGTGRFNISYSGLMDTPSRAFFDTVLTDLFSSGTFVSVGETDYAKLLSNPILMFEYAFPMPANIFPVAFNPRSSTVLTGQGVDAFTSIAIWLPDDGNESGLRVFFINDDAAWEFTVDSVAAEGFPVTAVSTIALHFVSAALEEEYEELPPNVFIPRTGDFGQFSYYPVVVTNPYFSYGQGLAHVRGKVAPFFDNPATINSRVAGDGVWTFSNIHATVRYFGTGVLEYANFRPRRQGTSSSFISDFSAALSFINNDEYVINEIFLMGYEPHGAGYVFRFGYIINYFPILMPDGWPVSSPDDILLAPIEVYVEEGWVVFYRRLTHNFSLDTQNLWLQNNRLNLDAILQGREEPITGLSLGYNMRSMGNLILGLQGW
ncbi:MAG: hypothetical protein FWE42_03215 [Defluviitaleaceae bacterium]|nr:hypothetical protein [Defluviitaleaceae bacterium]